MAKLLMEEIIKVLQIFIWRKIGIYCNDFVHPKVSGGERDPFPCLSCLRSTWVHQEHSSLWTQSWSWIISSVYLIFLRFRPTELLKKSPNSVKTSSFMGFALNFSVILTLWLPHQWEKASMLASEASRMRCITPELRTDCSRRSWSCLMEKAGSSSAVDQGTAT